MNSMTAFSRQALNKQLGSMSIEIRTVNHRYLDLHIRLPEEIRFTEPSIRKSISASLSRGRVDLTIKYSPASLNNTRLNIESIKQVRQYEKLLTQLNEDTQPLSSIDILNWPGVLETPAQDETLVLECVNELINSALNQVQNQRLREGNHTRDLLLQRIKQLKTLLNQVRVLLPETIKNFQDNFTQKLAHIKIDFDEYRLEQELAMFLSKQDIAEEVDRLAIHLDEVTQTMQLKGPSGRRLDFLMQELNRETNTLTSKSVDVRLNKLAIDMKVLIEQMREQIQNIE